MGPWLDAHLTAPNFWQFVAFISLCAAVVWAFIVQRKPENGVNFLELVYEPGTSRLAPERFAYVGAFIVTSVGFVFGVTRPTATLEGIATLMVTYGGLWVTGSAVKRFTDRPPAPVIPPAPVVNVNQPTGGQ